MTAAAASPDFGAAVATWHDFYGLTGATAAALMGLLCVSVSLDERRFFGSTGRRGRYTGRPSTRPTPAGVGRTRVRRNPAAA